MTWTHFHDMHSGGSQKLQWGHIYIEAPEQEARVIFYNRFGRNPERVTCTCCGEDYSISEYASLEQATGFSRGCRSIEPKRRPDGRYINDDPVIEEHCYLEEGEDPPEGYEISKWSPHSPYLTVEEYFARTESKGLLDGLALRIPAGEIRAEERTGTVPEEGYVWAG